jgi:hypothetical protein
MVVGVFDCSCVAGYAGLTCDENIHECDSAPCLNDGACIDQDSAYVCDCAAGFDGDNCEVRRGAWTRGALAHSGPLWTTLDHP